MGACAQAAHLLGELVGCAREGWQSVACFGMRVQERKRTERDVVRLELALGGGLRVRKANHRKGLAGGGEGGVVDAGDASSER